MRVACLGAGYFARFHHDGWRRVEGVELVACADSDVTRAEAVGVEAFAALEPMLEAMRPDILDIIVPPEGHLAAIRTALDAGIRAIICQKPFCATPEEALGATELAEAAGAVLVVHENFRFQPWYRRMRDVLEAGTLGDVQQMSFRLRTGDGQGPEAYLARQPYFQTMPRLLIHETGVHWIDTFRYLLGPIEAVYADLRRRNPAIRGEDAGHVLFDHAGGVVAHFDGNRLLDHATDDPRLTFGEALLEGTAGSLTLYGNGAVELRRHGARDGEVILAPRAWPGFAGDCVHALQAHVAAALGNGAQPENTARDYLAVIAAERAVYASAGTGRKVEVADHA